MASGPIALYRARDRITYYLMPEDSPQSVVNITSQTARKAVEGRTSLKASKMHKIIAACTTDVPDDIFRDFTSSVSGKYFRFPAEYNIFRILQLRSSSTPVANEFFAYPLPTPRTILRWDYIPHGPVSQPMPNLRTLSIFLQGPLVQPQTYENISRCLTRMRGELKDLNFMAVRFPQLALDSWVAALQGLHKYHRGETDRQLVSMRDQFYILQPPVGNGQQPWEVADLDIGGEKGWRLGTMYQTGNLRLDTINVRYYAIFTEAEDLGGTTWGDA